jgi:hypothetical protein
MARIATSWCYSQTGGLCILNGPDSMFTALTDVLLLSYLFAGERLKWAPLCS